MAGLTQPLEFRRFIRSEPRPGFDVVPFFDALLIATFIALNFSVFVIAPGASIQLPDTSSLQSVQNAPTAVLTIDRNELYFFGGSKLSGQTVGQHLAGFIRKHPDAGGKATLLIKADSSISTGVLFNLMDIARECGFARVHLAAEPNGLSGTRLWKAPGETPGL